MRIKEHTRERHEQHDEERQEIRGNEQAYDHNHQHGRAERGADMHHREVRSRTCQGFAPQDPHQALKTASDEAEYVDHIGRARDRRPIEQQCGRNDQKHRNDPHDPRVIRKMSLAPQEDHSNDHEECRTDQIPKPCHRNARSQKVGLEEARRAKPHQIVIGHQKRETKVLERWMNGHQAINNGLSRSIFW